MAENELSIHDVSHLLADTLTSNFNLEDQLKHVKQAESQEASSERLCRLLEIQLGFNFCHEGGSFYHSPCEPHQDVVHGQYSLALHYAVDTACRTMNVIGSKKRLHDGTKPFCFFMLPLEIRLEVYFYCLIGKSTWVDSSTFDRGGLYPRDWQHATKGLSNAILCTNRQVHDEAEPVLYQSHAFDFSLDLDQGLKFLQRISERARFSIRSISMSLAFFVKPEDADWENLEDWSSACAYIAKNLRLQELTFDCFVKAVPAKYTKEKWVQDLIQIRGLKKLLQRAEMPYILRHDMSKYGKADEEPNNILRARLRALLEYLRSEMLADDATAPSADDTIWECGQFGNQSFDDDEEPDW